MKDHKLLPKPSQLDWYQVKWYMLQAHFLTEQLECSVQSIMELTIDDLKEAYKELRNEVKKEGVWYEGSFEDFMNNESDFGSLSSNAQFMMEVMNPGSELAMGLKSKSPNAIVGALLHTSAPYSLRKITNSPYWILQTVTGLVETVKGGDTPEIRKKVQKIVNFGGYVEAYPISGQCGQGTTMEQYIYPQDADQSPEEEEPTESLFQIQTVIGVQETMIESHIERHDTDDLAEIAQRIVNRHKSKYPQADFPPVAGDSILETVKVTLCEEEERYTRIGFFNSTDVELKESLYEHLPLQSE